jgi:hypothetical protein
MTTFGTSILPLLTVSKATSLTREEKSLVFQISGSEINNQTLLYYSSMNIPR